MKAWVIDKYKTAMRLADLPDPLPAEGEVLVRVHAAGVNLLDSLIRMGTFKAFLPYKMPQAMGHDMAGVVVGLGRNVRGFKVGDEVFARVPDFHIGTFAEVIAVKESALALKPANLTMEAAASLPLVALTAWQAMVQIAGLRAGQKVFIQAGSGGVGTVAIQLAKHIGAYVATTASGSNAAWLKSLGADLVIDYKTEDFSAILKDYDLVLHSQDAKTLAKSLTVLRRGGRLVSLTGPATPAAAGDLGIPWVLRPVIALLARKTLKQARKLGVGFDFLFMKADGAQLAKIAALVEAGHIRPVVETIYPFDEAGAALSQVEAGRVKGKVVIKVG